MRVASALLSSLMLTAGNGGRVSTGRYDSDGLPEGRATFEDQGGGQQHGGGCCITVPSRS